MVDPPTISEKTYFTTKSVAIALRKYIQATCISAVLHCGTSVNVLAIYCTPKHKLNKNDYLIFLLNYGDKFIISCDFNAKHQS